MKCFDPLPQVLEKEEVNNAYIIEMIKSKKKRKPVGRNQAGSPFPVRGGFQEGFRRSWWELRPSASWFPEAGKPNPPAPEWKP